MATMRTNSQKGAELIAKYKDFSRGALMIRDHHERWDASGYPDGLKEYEIPFGARVIAIADSFDFANAMLERNTMEQGLIR